MGDDPRATTANDSAPDCKAADAPASQSRGSRETKRAMKQAEAQPTGGEPTEGRTFVEIYALCTPGTTEIRYIGKAKNSEERLKRHFNEAQHNLRPVHNWLRKLGQDPTMIVLEVVPEADWPNAERKWIAAHKGPKLLNVAPGGDQPSQTPAQRSAAARAANRSAKADPALKAFYDSVRGCKRMQTQCIKEGRFQSAYWLGFLAACHQAGMRARLGKK